MICAPDGGIIDDLIVYRLGETLPGGRQRRQRADRLGRAGRAADRVHGRARRPLAGDRPARGPGTARASRSSRPLTDVDLAALRYYASAEGTVAGIDALVARTGYTGEDGFEVFVDTTADAPSCGTPCSRRSARTTGCRSGWALATRSGSRPACRSTATSSTATPIPTRPASGGSSSWTKPGDFVGRAALEKVARDGPQRKLVGLDRRGPRDRPSRLPGLVRRPANRGRDQRDPVADPRRADRDGLRRAERRRAGYRCRRRDPRRPRPGARRRPAVLQEGA